ncbi:MAG: hypothetical protein ACQGVC_11695 [Myxococcota bacterium]
MSGPARELKARVAESVVDPAAVAKLLDGMSHAERVEATHSLGRGEQRRLYAAVDRFLPLCLEDLVPAGVADFTPVRHYGRNTLPAFTHFEKRFCRPRGADPAKPDALYGFNFQTLSKVTGPGYFVAVEAEGRPEVLVDYNRVPDTHPDGWPDIKPNDIGLSRFVYGFMIDTLRRVSEHVTIGSAARKGRDLGSWFILTRED